ncbi:MAG: TVP38/TMEM64 family protein [Opitutales bacterium]
MDPTSPSPGGLRLKSRWLLLLILAGVLIGGAAVAWLWSMGVRLADVRDWAVAILDYLGERPLLLFAAILILPGFSFPISPLLVLAGAVFGERYGLGWAVLICIGTVSLCMAWTWWACAYPLRGLIQTLLRARGWSLPEVSERRMLQVAFLVRATPGIPFAIQNAVLGVMRMPFRPYILVSVAVQAVYTTGFVLSGEALFSGNLKLVVAGLAILVVASLAFRAVSRKRRSPLNPDSPEAS